MSNEAKARLKINKLLENSDWVLNDTPNSKANVVVENKVSMNKLWDEVENDTIGFIDYLLLDSQGFPLAVLEAKSENKDPVIGKEQARNYALSKKCRYVILSNGLVSYFWDLNKSAEERIETLPTQKQLMARNSRNTSMSLASLNIGTDWIVQSQGNVSDEVKRYLRDYQLEAVNSVFREFDSKKDRFLLELATGTGKTLIACAIMKAFFKSNQAKRILFIVDTIDLVDQAFQNINSYLKEHTVGIFKLNKEEALENQIIVATIQSLANKQNYLKYFNAFDFDLIISDEAHRSIQGVKSRAIFEYFNAAKLGLTATPKDYLKGVNIESLSDSDPRKLEKRVQLDTYSTFGCESGEPTFRFNLKDAVNHNPPYLVNPIIFDKRSEKTNQMLSASGWKDTFLDSVTGEEIEETFKIRDFERKVFSESLNELMCLEFLKTAKPDPITGETGKSIIYCISQNHASKMTRLLNRIADKKWPGKYNAYNGMFARQVTSGIDESQELSKLFRNNNLGNTRIVVTVKMMTTGYDCTDLLNIGLMKPVFGVSDFIQMKGRGTRLHAFKDKLRSSTIEKDNFHLIDFFGVCEYFEEDYDYSEPLVLKNQRIDLVDAPIATPSDDGTDCPFYVEQGDYLWFGKDFIIKDDVLVIGKDCMKIDREAFKSDFETEVKQLLENDLFFRKALLNDEILDAENIATIKLLNKPKHYYTLEALRKVYESKANLYEYLKLAAGMIEALPDKFNEIRNIFSEYKLTHPELNYEKLKWIENIFECYFTNSNYKNALISGDYSVLNNQSLGGVVNPAKITSTELLSAIKFLRNVEVNYVN